MVDCDGRNGCEPYNLFEGIFMSEKMLAHVHEKTRAEQTVAEHNHNVGALAAAFLQPAGLSACGELAGRIHDIGKSCARWQAYFKDPHAVRGSVTHTFAAAQLLMRRYSHDTGDVRDLTAEVLVLAACSHHGLFDCIGPDGVTGVQHRLDRVDTSYDEVLHNISAEIPDFDVLFDAAVVEFQTVLGKLSGLFTDPSERDVANREMQYYVAMLVRLLASAVVDADRRDTASFLSGRVYEPEMTDAEYAALWAEKLAAVKQYLPSLFNNSEMSRVRQEICDACEQAAEMPPGVFQLRIGTGGGKTLSSLVFAMKHALLHHMRGIVVSAPLLTIIEQNAQAIRDAIQDDSIVLEHHSNVTWSKSDAGEGDWSVSEAERRAMLCEGWNSPVIITTAWQLLTILFSSDLSYARRMHRLSKAVIIIDEVQKIPNKMLSMFCSGINFLAHVCGASVVLCSATQPKLQDITHRVRVPVRDIKTPYERHLNLFRRVRAAYRKAPLDCDGVVDLALASVQDYGSNLIVCNTTRQAREIYEALCERGVKYVHHLSARMCASDRRKVLGVMLDELKQHKPVICVATRVIEAGVDISFGSAICFMCGLDSIVQVIGRVNRSWELGVGRLGQVYIVHYKGEDLSWSPELIAGKGAAEAVLAGVDAADDIDIESDAMLSQYYEKLYQREENQGVHDYKVSVQVGCGEKQTSIYELMSFNSALASNVGLPAGQGLRFALATAGRHFEVFGCATRPVIMGYDDASRGIIARLNSSAAAQDMSFARRLLRDAAQYMVALYPQQLASVRSEVIELPGGALGLLGHYIEGLGFSEVLADSEFA